MAGRQSLKTRNPKQKRSIETKERIMEAARTLFSEKGIHDTSSNEIVEKAGVSIGSFYSYFSNKRDLYLEVLERYINTISEEILSEDIELHYQKSTLDIRKTLHLYLKKVFRGFDMDPRFHARTIALRFTDNDIARIYDAAEKRELEYIRKILVTFDNITPLAVENFDLSAKIIHGSIAYLIHSIKFLGYRGDENMLLDELARSIAAYITPRP